MLNASISFRPMTDDDLPFIRRLFDTTRETEMAMVPWNDQEKEDFLAQQFHAQHTYYKDTFPDTKFDLILEDGEPIGRLYLDWRDEELRIIDISLMPEYRGKGIGGTIMQDLLDQAAAKGKAVGIHVEMNNPAMHLYERLGFKKLEEQGLYYLMEWKEGSD